MRAADWLIIGGGIPALVCAFYLQQRGETVIVIDNNNPSASRAGAGILAPLPPWRYAAVLHQLAAAGAEAYPSLLAAVNDDCGWRRTGMLVFPPFDEESLTRWRQKGGEAKMVDAAALSAHLPAVDAAYLPRVCTLKPRALIKALRRKIVQRQVATVASVAVKRGRVQYVGLADGRRCIGHRVLLSAGVWSRALCPPPSPSITPVRGQMIVYRNNGIMLPTVLLKAQQDFYLLQRNDGYLLAGSTSEQVGFDDMPTAAGMQKLQRQAAALIPALAGHEPRGGWAGLRPAAARPIIAHHPTVENLYVNSGHFRYGVTMAPAAAEHLMRIADGRLDEKDNLYGWH